MANEVWFAFILAAGLLASFLVQQNLMVYGNGTNGIHADAPMVGMPIKNGNLSQPSDKQPVCMSDSDCVPAQCCHAVSCVPKASAPNCSGVFCTQECRPNTLDCGQGRCRCIEGRCVAEIGNGIK